MVMLTLTLFQIITVLKKTIHALVPRHNPPSTSSTSMLDPFRKTFIVYPLSLNVSVINITLLHYQKLG